MSFYNKIVITFAAIAVAWVIGYSVYYTVSDPMPEAMLKAIEAAKAKNEAANN